MHSTKDSSEMHDAHDWQTTHRRRKIQTRRGWPVIANAARSKNLHQQSSLRAVRTVQNQMPLRRNMEVRCEHVTRKPYAQPQGSTHVQRALGTAFHARSIRRNSKMPSRRTTLSDAIADDVVVLRSHRRSRPGNAEALTDRRACAREAVCPSVPRGRHRESGRFSARPMTSPKSCTPTRVARAAISRRRPREPQRSAALLLPTAPGHRRGSY